MNSLRAELLRASQSSSSLNGRLKISEEKSSRIQSDCARKIEEAEEEKGKAVELQKSLTEEAATIRQKHEALRSAVMVAFRDVKTLRAALQEEKDSTMVSIRLLQQQMTSDSTTVNLALKEHSQLKKDFAAKRQEAEEASKRVAELEKSLHEIVDDCQKQLQKQASINKSLYDERVLLLAKIDELSNMSHNETNELNLLVEKLTYELDFKAENLSEAEAKIQELGKLLSKNQKQHQKSNEQLQAETDALRSQIVDLKAALSTASSATTAKSEEMEEMKKDFKRREGLLESRLKDSQTEAASLKEKTTLLTGQLQQLVEIIEKQQQKRKRIACRAN